MSVYFDVITNSVTGEVTRRDWTPEEIEQFLAYANKVKVPESITPRQVRLLLLQKNMLAEVEAMISQQGEAIRITWEYALEFRRDDPLLAQFSSDLGLTTEQVDAFFIEASRL